jgi:general secretion pathway protein H
MPTSATGSSSRSAGFTLVEVMVVLAIVGLMSAVVALSLPASGDDLRREGERLAARLAAARDSAILGNRETAAVIDARGYRFEERAGRAWREIDERPLVATPWREGTRPGATARIGFDAVGLSEPASVVLVNGEHRARVRVAASGEVRVDAAR